MVQIHITETPQLQVFTLDTLSEMLKNVPALHMDFFMVYLSGMNP
jgi:hypothetical protein